MSFFLFIYIQTFSNENKIIDIDSLKKASNITTNDTLRIYLWNEIAGYYKNINPDTTLLIYNEVLKHVNEKLLNFNISQYLLIKKYYNYKALLLRDIGGVYYDLGKYEEYIKSLTKSLEIEISFNNQKGIALCYNEFGHYYNIQDKNNKALEYYLMALKIGEKLKNNQLISMFISNIAHIYDKQNKYNEALAYYFKSLEIEKSGSRFEEIALRLVFIGNLYVKKEQNDSAIVYFNEALKIGKQKNIDEILAITYNSLGNVSNNIGKHNDAIIYYLQSLNIIEKTKNKRKLATLFHNIATTFYKISIQNHSKSSLFKAIDYGKNAYKYGLELKSLYLQKKSALTLSNIYKQLGEYKQSLYYSNIQNTIADSMYNEEVSKTYDIEVKYKNEKNILEIEKLNKEKTIQNKEIELQRLKSKKQKIINIYSIIVIVIIGVFLAIIIKRLIITRKHKTIIEHNKRLVEEKNLQLNLQNQEIIQQRDLVTLQKKEIEEYLRNQTSSINYALRIQQALFPSLAILNNLCKNYFLIYKPKDIVSGDFYWFTTYKNYNVFCVADCTGHGVPGAFMSFLGITFLNEIIHKQGITESNKILDMLRANIISALKQENENSYEKSGMDISVCVIDENTNIMQYSGAYNPCWLIPNNDYYNERIVNVANYDIESNTMIKIKADRMPVAIHKKMQNFGSNEIQLYPGDKIYLMTDGFQDQFGGEDNQKFSSKALSKLIIENSTLTMEKQKQILENTLEKWKGSFHQIDDICILGIET